jgi:hypothetical protein
MPSSDLQRHGRHDTAIARGRDAPLARRREAPAPEVSASTASLVKDAFGDALEVLEAHVELAVLEVREDARVAAKVATAFGIGAALSILAATFLLAAAAFGLAQVLPTWLACLLVGAMASLAALVAVLKARRMYQGHDFRPERTIEVVQEKREWRAEKRT